MAPLFASSTRRHREAMVGPLASDGNEAIGAKSQTDTIDSSVTVHLVLSRPFADMREDLGVGQSRQLALRQPGQQFPPDVHALVQGARCVLIDDALLEGGAEREIAAVGFGETFLADDAREDTRLRGTCVGGVELTRQRWMIRVGVMAADAVFH